ncbi:CubicO group peptidase (beta-lactamase class C family) [Stackebrandtia albiflava]|uniref:CubicO group peptidase (Beta-lactamase class C family) n=1 Tax=Stackebrandtia albiflava TaxID=406432 RepID=A0A562VEK1_9ACTN|nr:serine hydrolase domain-containing protein [Stackebrandtia albiflava]TWJ16295.1 CubicO group peptidase (beta-lactamase class C family) [Stackebrandtia albiflava]
MSPIHGECATGYAAVCEAFARGIALDGETGAAVAVYHHGRKVVDLWAGRADPFTGEPWRRDTLTVVYSATKGVTAACALLLAERGLIDLDAPVSRYWPEFAAAGKARIPVRWLLSHRAGLSALDRRLPRADVLDGRAVVKALERQAPCWPPGTRHGYHALTFGWLVAELVRRVDGRGLGTLLAEEITGPAGIDFHIGLPKEEWRRAARIVTGTDGTRSATASTCRRPLPWGTTDSLRDRSFVISEPPLDHDDPAEQLVEIPASNGTGTAEALARFYAALVSAPDGHRILSTDTVAAATREESAGIDLVTGVPSRFGLGFALPTRDTSWYGPRAFGFAGMSGALGFADPDTGIGFGYVTNGLHHGRIRDRRAARIVAALRACL